MTTSIPMLLVQGGPGGEMPMVTGCAGGWPATTQGGSFG